MLTVLKLGGELLDDAEAIAAAAHAVVRLSSRGPLVVIHGGGRAIDDELRARGGSPRFVDGLRVTDQAALDAAVAVLAGRNNTTLVAAIGAAGGRAVGLTGADGRIGLASRATTFVTVSGEQVDLGFVGQPESRDVSLLTDLLSGGWIPVVASIGVSTDGGLLNVNADALAGHLAAALHADRLIVSGATVGVLDANGRTIPSLTLDRIATMTASGAAHSGMIAKLAACRNAVLHGVSAVSIVCGCGVSDYETASGTVILHEVVAT